MKKIKFEITTTNFNNSQSTTPASSIKSFMFRHNNKKPRKTLKNNIKFLIMFLFNIIPLEDVTKHKEYFQACVWSIENKK